MSEIHEVTVDYAWSTHQPLLYMLLDVFNPKFIMELGVGFYSTPIFSKHDTEMFISIENDEEWLKHVQAINRLFHKNHIVIHHDLGTELTKYNFVKDLNEEHKNTLKEYYTNINNKYNNNSLYPKLLFVDNYTCCRTIAINTLYNNFDIIVYHDAEGVDWYEYYFDKELYDNYTKYILHTDRSWTGCFIKNNIKYDEQDLKTTIFPYILKYCEDNKADLAATYLKKEN